MLLYLIIALFVVAIVIGGLIILWGGDANPLKGSLCSATNGLIRGCN